MAMLGAAGRLYSALREPGTPPVPETDPPAAAPSRQPRVSTMPERSGCPSEDFGAGAVRFTLPSGVRGTPASGRRGHCAERDGDSAATSATEAAAESHAFMGTSRLPDYSITQFSWPLL